MEPSIGRHTAARHHGLVDQASQESRSGQSSARTLTAQSDAPLLPEKGCFSRVGLYVREFFEQSTLHGLRYMILENRNYFDV